MFFIVVFKTNSVACFTSTEALWVEILIRTVMTVTDVIIPTNVPTLVILVSNLIVVTVILYRKFNKSLSDTKESQKITTQDKQILTMLTLSGMAFLVLNVPYSVILLLYKVVGQESNVLKHLWYRLDQIHVLNNFQLTNISNAIFVFICQPLNYSINFYLYMLSRSYRSQFYNFIK